MLSYKKGCTPDCTQGRNCSNNSRDKASRYDLLLIAATVIFSYIIFSSLL